LGGVHAAFLNSPFYSDKRARDKSAHLRGRCPLFRDQPKQLPGLDPHPLKMPQGTNGVLKAHIWWRGGNDDNDNDNDLAFAAACLSVDILMCLSEELTPR
jgi:hypothetical protein